jgi:hypothetical protein
MQNAEQTAKPEGSLSLFAFTAVMQSDEMWVLGMKEKKAQECPWMTKDELHDYMMDLYADRKEDRLHDRDHYNF